LLAGALAAGLVVLGAPADGQEASVRVLHIGASSPSTGKPDTRDEKAARKMLGQYIREEIGLRNDITQYKNWRELVDRMKSGKSHLGVFQGFEFAWAKEKEPGLKPLTVIINVDRYPHASLLVSRRSKVRDLAGGLQGKALAVPATGQEHLRLFVERACLAQGKGLEAFFGKVVAPENAEDALDDVFDGKVQAAVVDGASLKAYKRRKPGRFKGLREIARSEPFPPAVVAYYDSFLNPASRQRFRNGLLGADRKRKGRMLLHMFRITGFAAVPADFGKALTRARKAYPAPELAAKAD
jgi:ABC-type phosphate/phosphonate transport system substrate-binding protein